MDSTARVSIWRFAIRWHFTGVLYAAAAIALGTFLLTWDHPIPGEAFAGAFSMAAAVAAVMTFLAPLLIPVLALWVWLSRRWPWLEATRTRSILNLGAAALLAAPAMAIVVYGLLSPRAPDAPIFVWPSMAELPDTLKFLGAMWLPPAVGWLVLPRLWFWRSEPRDMPRISVPRK
jgi:hypothetical protein